MTSVNMGQQEDSTPVTMEGYLDKRSKKKLMSSWKRYWFVLKGQLLLYYKTQHECNNLSVCRGSLNMGLASCVRPGANRGPPANANQGYTIEVVTRTQVIILRTKDRSLQEQWLKGLLDSMALPISTPIRNSTGPMHFRYSMDNLPVIEEAESEDKNKAKQSTLPHQSSVSRRDSLLGRIKKIGGTSYGGSLETVIKRQQSQQQSPQQPKIPRIKAIDRMLGLQQTDEEEVNDSDNQSASQNGDKSINNSKSDVSSLDTSTDSNKKSQSEIVKPETLEYSEVKKKNGNRSFIRKNDQNQNCVAKSEETKNLTWSMIEKEKHVLYIENNEGIVIENKLYVDLENKENRETAEDKSEHKINSDKGYDSEEEISGYNKIKNIIHGSKIYEEVTTAKQNEKSELEEEEEEYYSQYDKLSLLRSLSDKEHEPTLPPRPSVSSKSSNEFTKSQNENNVNKEGENVEYNSLYETTLNTTTANSKLESSGGQSSPRQKKKSKLHKLTRRKKKSQSKESLNSEDGQRDGKKKKRKMSFLHRMLKHYRKKPESQTTADDAEESEDPEYERVDYSVALSVQVDAENDQTQSAPSEIESPGSSPEKEIHKERIFGTNLLSEQGMRELKMKLKGRDDSVDDDDTAPLHTVPQDKEENECNSSEDVREKKPVPTPRPSKQKPECEKESFENTKSQNSRGIDRPHKPPRLPPRKVGRPPSPWHDVPKNNSPVYGNFQDLAPTNENKVEEPHGEVVTITTPQDNEDKEEAKPAELDQDIRDELLGTPQGFAYIQSKWKAVEKGEINNKGMLSPVLKSPGKNRSFERSSNDYKGSHIRSCSSSSIGKSSVKSEYSDTEQNCSTSEVYTEIQRLSAKSIIKNFNSQCNKNSETSRNTCDSDFVNETIKLDPVKTESVRSETCVKCNIDTSVTLRRLQGIPQKTEFDDSVLQNKNDFSSSHDGLKGEFRKRSDSSTQTSQISFSDSLEVGGNGEGEQYDIMPRLNRHSDELNVLLAQLAEITSAPLIPQGVASSLSDIAEDRKSKIEVEKPPEPSPQSEQQFVLGPIRRRRHSDPDYDVPRPHGSLLHLLAANRMSNRSSQSHSGQESDVIEATHFFGEQELISNSGRSSLSLRHSVISEVEDQSDTSYYVSMAPDSLEVPQVKDVEGIYT